MSSLERGRLVVADGEVRAVQRSVRVLHERTVVGG